MCIAILDLCMSGCGVIRKTMVIISLYEVLIKINICGYGMIVECFINDVLLVGSHHVGLDFCICVFVALGVLESLSEEEILKGIKMNENKVF